MAFPLSFPFVFGIPLLPARRVIAVDPGSRVIKVALVQLFLGRVKVIRCKTLELPEGQSQKDELEQQLGRVIKEMGPYPVALTLPQHLTLSQVIELPSAPQSDVRKLIENETVKLGGLSETRIIHDYSALSPFGRHQHSYWITLCQEKEFAAEVERLELDREAVCDATSVGNALRAAYLARIPATTPTVLADIGWRSTTVVILYRGQGVYIASVPIGAEMLFEPVANERSCTMAEAALRARQKNLFEGPDASAMLPFAVDNWHDELVRVVREWLMDHSELQLDLHTFQFVLSGGGASPLGITAHLNRRFGATRFVLWPQEEGSEEPAGQYGVAIGTGMQALGKNPQSASLLPQDLRAKWTEQKAAQRIQSVCFLLLLLLTTLLVVGTWQKMSLARHKEQLVYQAELALQQVEENNTKAQCLARDYERIRPALDRQRRTIDVIQTLVTLQQVRSNRALWFGLFADQQSYFGTPLATNEVNVSNLVTMVTPPSSDSPNTNRPAIQPNLIAEIGIPEGGEAMRRTLSQVVAGLKQSPRFRNVDILPAEQRRPLADPKLILPDRYFTIAFELADSEFKPETASTGAKATNESANAAPGGRIVPGRDEGGRGR